MFVPLSVLEFRYRAASFFGDRIGVVDGEQAFTYRAFAERTHRLANALIDLGVVPGDRVSFLTYNTHHLLEAYYGVLEAGAVLNPVNVRLSPHEIGYILDHARSRVVVFHRDFLPLVESIAPGLDAYSASKAGIFGLVRVMAADYAREGIRVNGVFPGITDTPMNDWWRHNPEQRAEVEASVPLGRAGRAEEVAAVIAFLCSDDASYVTGAVWAVDRGLTAV